MKIIVAKAAFQYHIQKLNHVDSAAQILQNLDLALDFALFDWL